ncbi:hypothetical protein [[Actinomadura] parvosata]|uniref:hypothetical protein n=1 Tax=[Actinomadura] parvosata TaxID=1955412 RepID=UPI001648720E
MADLEEVGLHGAGQPVRLGGDGLPELRAQPVDLGPDGDGVAGVAVQVEGELFGREAVRVEGQEGEEFGVAE